ncbi:DUF2726 domain-containing protein [Burkholderiaceae bacterium DAT-1]|nr:DUF2726 domain-containing protein [Burkholderiaceae bacterium DAT-1]
MMWMITALLLAGLILIVLRARSATPVTPPILKEQPSLRYTTAPALFTPAERSFLGVLDGLLGPSYRVFGKVRVADVLVVRKGFERGEWQRLQNMIHAKHFDYVICRADDLKVMGIIELDDKSHHSSERKARDELLDAACKEANLPILHVAAKASYVLSDIDSQIRIVLGIDIRGVQQRVGVHASMPVVPLDNPTISVPPPSAYSPADVNSVLGPPCPKCEGNMVKRIVKSGTHAGKAFWSCANHPGCNGMRVVEVERG